MQVSVDTIKLNALLKYSYCGNISYKHNIVFTSECSFTNKLKKPTKTKTQQQQNRKQKNNIFDISQCQGDRSFPFWVKRRCVFFTALCSKHLLTLSLDISCCRTPVKKIKNRRSGMFQTVDSV